MTSVYVLGTKRFVDNRRYTV